MKISNSLIAAILFTLFSIQTYASSDIIIPTDRIDAMNIYIKKNLLVTCNQPTEEDVSFICRENDDATIGICRLEINGVRIQNKDTQYQCSIYNKNSSLGKKMTFNINKSVEGKEIPVFDRTHEFKKKTLQEKSLSCESSATSDILSAITGTIVTEDDVIAKLEKSSWNKKAKKQNGVTIWGNPQEGFVGYIDTDGEGKTASQRRMTGYGVLEEPIAKVFESYGLETKIIKDTDYTQTYGATQHLEELLTLFNEGNYVQLWGDICTQEEFDDGEIPLSDITQEDVDAGKNGKNSCWSYGQDRKLVWYYNEGDHLIRHQGLIGEHAFYLLGYVGEVDSPTHVIVWDTFTGRHEIMIEEWMRKWGEMQNRSIVIYKDSGEE